MGGGVGGVGVGGVGGDRTVCGLITSSEQFYSQDKASH